MAEFGADTEHPLAFSEIAHLGVDSVNFATGLRTDPEHQAKLLAKARKKSKSKRKGSHAIEGIPNCANRFCVERAKKVGNLMDECNQLQERKITLIEDADELQNILDSIL